MLPILGGPQDLGLGAARRFARRLRPLCSPSALPCSLPAPSCSFCPFPALFLLSSCLLLAQGVVYIYPYSPSPGYNFTRCCVEGPVWDPQTWLQKMTLGSQLGYFNKIIHSSHGKFLFLGGCSWDPAVPRSPFLGARSL